MPDIRLESRPETIIAAKSGDYDKALLHLERAVRMEEAALYNEPPDWFYPVRHTLGAVLLEAGRPAEADGSADKCRAAADQSTGTQLPQSVQCRDDDSL